MTDQPTGPAADEAPTPAPNRGAQIVAVLYATRDVLASLAPYAVAAYAICEAIKLNDPEFTKGLIYGLFSAALIAINPKAPAAKGSAQ